MYARDVVECGPASTQVQVAPIEVQTTRLEKMLAQMDEAVTEMEVRLGGCLRSLPPQPMRDTDKSAPSPSCPSSPLGEMLYQNANKLASQIDRLRSLAARVEL